MNEQSYVFRYIGGLWRDTALDAGILSDVLSQWEIELDYRTQFARLYDYERGLVFTYRAYSGAKITLTITKLQQL